MNDEETKKYMEIQKQFESLENVVKQKLSKEALTRYGNVKAAHPEKAVQVVAVVAQLIQQGQITDLISDDMFKGMLIKLKEPKKEFKITKK